MTKATKAQSPKTVNVAELIVKVADYQALKDSHAEGLSKANEGLQFAYQGLLDAKVTFGKSLRTCAHAKLFADELASHKMANGKPRYSAGTISNYVSAMRGALATRAKTLDLNRSRTKAKATPKASTKNGVAQSEQKPGTVETLPNEEKVSLPTREKVLVQLNNAVTIMANAEDSDFDVVKVSKQIKDIIASLQYPSK